MKLTNQIKIIILSVGFAAFTALMFMFGYDILAGRTDALANNVAQKRLELDVLQREQKSFEQGQIDLAELAKSSYPPEELFSSDTKVVKEIQLLESTAQKYSLSLKLSVAGTAESALKVAGTSGELFAVPYQLTLSGNFDNVLQFVQQIERMPFVTRVEAIAVNAVSDSEVEVVINSQFYIKK
jgi:Tfp pilus assembly protein PilO